MLDIGTARPHSGYMNTDERREAAITANAPMGTVIAQPAATRKGVLDEAEQVIRDLAGTVIAQVQARRHHPSYGYTKGQIRAALERMEGAIGLYQVLDGQTTHAGVPSLAAFRSSDLDIRVNTARDLVKGL